MAVLQMKRINICALKKDRKPVLELLQRRGAVEVDSVLPEDSVFSRTDTSANRSVFQKNITAAASALEILGQYAPEKKSMFASLEGRELKTGRDYDAFAQKYDTVMENVYQITAAVPALLQENKSGNHQTGRPGGSVATLAWVRAFHAL